MMNPHPKVLLSDIRIMILCEYPHCLLKNAATSIMMVMALTKASKKLTFGIKSPNVVAIIT